MWGYTVFRSIKNCFYVHWFVFHADNQQQGPTTSGLSGEVAPFQNGHLSKGHGMGPSNGPLTSASYIPYIYLLPSLYLVVTSFEGTLPKVCKPSPVNSHSFSAPIFFHFLLLRLVSAVFCFFSFFCFLASFVDAFLLSIFLRRNTWQLIDKHMTKVKRARDRTLGK